MAGLQGNPQISGGSPLARDLILSYEYFHGDNGAGLGASHQTGWTGIVARLMHLFATTTSEQVIELGKAAAVTEVEQSRGNLTSHAARCKVSTMRRPLYPSLYQINTRAWLTELSRILGRRATLEDVPDADLDHFAEMRFEGYCSMYGGNSA